MVDRGVFVIWYRGGLSVVYKCVKNNPVDWFTEADKTLTNLYVLVYTGEFLRILICVEVNKKLDIP